MNICAHHIAMRRIVLDTNCLLQTLPSQSVYHNVWAKILEGSVALCVNTEILEEYEEIIAQKATPEIAKNVVEAIARLSHTVFQESYVHFGLIEQDKDDNKFVDCAIASDAEYIVTNDKHFSVLSSIPWPKVAIIALKEFAEQLDFQTAIQKTQEEAKRIGLTEADVDSVIKEVRQKKRK